MNADSSVAPQLAGIRILLVEDDDTIRELLEDMLTLEGVEVTTASSGNEAIRMLKSCRPELILSDVMMADGDGHDLLQNVQADPILASIPFIFLTARSEPSELRRSMNLGADDYLVKPVARQDLIYAIRTRISRSKVAARYQRHLLDQFRDGLARTVPQELLTPVHTIRSASEVLAMEPGLGDCGKDLINMILQGCSQLNRLVNRFWKWNELQLELKGFVQGCSSARLHESHSDRIVELAYSLASAQKRAGDLSLDLMPLRMKIREDHLVLVVQELIENALKFSQPGQQVSLSLRELPGGWSLTVADQGVGMSPGQVAAVGIQWPIEQPIQGQEGAGLGLALVSAVVRANSLSLEFDRKRARGLAVTVSSQDGPAQTNP